MQEGCLRSGRLGNETTDATFIRVDAQVLVSFCVAYSNCDLSIKAIASVIDIHPHCQPAIV